MYKFWCCYCLSPSQFIIASPIKQGLLCNHKYFVFYVLLQKLCDRVESEGLKYDLQIDPCRAGPSGSHNITLSLEASTFSVVSDSMHDVQKIIDDAEPLENGIH